MSDTNNVSVNPSTSRRSPSPQPVINHNNNSSNNVQSKPPTISAERQWLDSIMSKQSSSPQPPAATSLSLFSEPSRRQPLFQTPSQEAAQKRMEIFQKEIDDVIGTMNMNFNEHCIVGPDKRLQELYRLDKEFTPEEWNCKEEKDEIKRKRRIRIVKHVGICLGFLILVILFLTFDYFLSNWIISNESDKELEEAHSGSHEAKGKSSEIGSIEHKAKSVLPDSTPPHPSPPKPPTHANSENKPQSPGTPSKTSTINKNPKPESSKSSTINKNPKSESSKSSAINKNPNSESSKPSKNKVDKKKSGESQSLGSSDEEQKLWNMMDNANLGLGELYERGHDVLDPAEVESFEEGEKITHFEKDMSGGYGLGKENVNNYNNEDETGLLASNLPETYDTDDGGGGETIGNNNRNWG